MLANASIQIYSSIESVQMLRKCFLRSVLYKKDNVLMRSPKSKKMQTLKVDAFQIKFLRKKWEKIIEDENTEILNKGKRTRLGDMHRSNFGKNELLYFDRFLNG